MARQTRKSKHKTQTRKQHSNAKAVFDLVPVDVLLKVFSWVKALYEKEFSGRKRVGWVVITHICQHWRDSAIACGTLWSDIFSSNPDVTEWLKRAGGCALSVNLELEEVADEAVLILVLQKLAQIRTLSIEIASSVNEQMHWRMWSYLQTLSSDSAPLLEYFTLENKKQGPWPPFRFFADNAPALKEFTLFGCAPVLPSPCFDNLRTLCLSNSCPPLNKFTLLAQLVQMPGLKYLVLMNVIIPMEEPMDAVPNIPVTYLPELIHITLLGISFNNDLDLLSRLSFKAEPSVRFISQMKTPDFSAFPRFIDAYNQIMQNPVEFVRLDVEWVNNIFRVRGSTTACHGEPPTFLLELHSPWEDDFFPTSWGEELVRLSLNSLKFLYVDCDIGDTSWALLSKRCPALTYLWVRGEAANEFFNYLIDDYKENCPSIEPPPCVQDANDTSDPKMDLTGEVSEKPDAVSTWDPVFPNLQTLDIADMDFEDGQTMVETFYLALCERLGHARSVIHDICIEDCPNFDRRMLKVLKRGITIYWDDVEYPATGLMDSDDEENEAK